MSKIIPQPDDQPVDAIPVEVPVDPEPLPVEEVKEVSPKEFATALAEEDLIAQLKDLRAQYDALLPPDPYAEDRRQIALKMQAVRERLQQI